MFKIKTSELEKKLEQTHPSELSKYIDDNKEELLLEDREFMKYMTKKLKEKNLKKQDVLLKADISLGYGYKLFSQEKTTQQRDVILRICYAAGFSVAEVQHTLKIYHMDTLYARDTRDALLMACFNQPPGSVLDVNELLIKNNMKPLRPCGMIE